MPIWPSQKLMSSHVKIHEPGKDFPRGRNEENGPNEKEHFAAVRQAGIPPTT